jgi:hypothetical protein
MAVLTLVLQAGFSSAQVLWDYEAGGKLIIGNGSGRLYAVNLEPTE